MKSQWEMMMRSFQLVSSPNTPHFETEKVGISRDDTPYVPAYATKRILEDSNCNGRGTFKEGKCICDNPYFGEECQYECHHGKIENDFCTCESKWKGPFCDVSCDHGYYDPTATTGCRCLRNYVGPDCGIKCVNGQYYEGRCYCDVGYVGDECDLLCYHGTREVGDDPDRTPYCKCEPGYIGPACQFSECFYGEWDDPESETRECKCYPWAFHSGRYRYVVPPTNETKAVLCDTLRNVVCDMVITSPKSQCSPREQEANPNSFCIKWERGKDITLEYGLRCAFTKGDITEKEPKGYGKAEGSILNESTTIVKDGDIIFMVSSDTKISLRAQLINFNRMSNNKIFLAKQTYSDVQLNYSFVPNSSDIIFPYPIKIDMSSLDPDNSDAFDPPLRDFIITNRMNLELSANLTSDKINFLPNSNSSARNRYIARIVSIKNKWIYIDYPFMKPPKYKPPRLDTFVIVIIVIVSIIALLVVIYALFKLRDYFRDKKEEKEEEAQRKLRKHKLM
eukprot:MONOS_1799.1-p1 / transcript=MONOS_1799.1 / gene=MONOS_1799 / organism=Monocercomonoides_exilis_PA203 / gene_product=unspecified product / transcript_product=unspecified product / location=Mono_scaffold00034:346-2367(+) / protein_length=506 / sequence_SO=supercontig / SO=protein_coding / is_pseudo=false